MDRDDMEATMAVARQEVSVVNEQGLHARPVMQFVDLANRFTCKIAVCKGDQRVDGKSPMEIMLLEAVNGTILLIEAQGPDAEDAVRALVQLVDSGFANSSN